MCSSITDVFVNVFARAEDASTSLERRLTALFAEVGVLGASSPSIVGFITGISAVVTRHPEVFQGTEAFGAEFRKMTLHLIETSTESILAGLGRLSARGDQDRHLAAGDMYLRLIRAASRK